MTGRRQMFTSKLEVMKMAKIFGIHEIELLPDADAAAFERFVLKELPKPFPGWTLHLAKGDRGSRSGRYAVIFELDTTSRARYSPSENQLNDEGKRLADAVAAQTAKMATFTTTVMGTNSVFTDYVVAGSVSSA
jgi:hypothetical protein